MYCGVDTSSGEALCLKCLLSNEQETINEIRNEIAILKKVR